MFFVTQLCTIAVGSGLDFLDYSKIESITTEARLIMRNPTKTGQLTVHAYKVLPNQDSFAQ